MKPLTITQLANQVCGEVVGNGATEITGFAPANAAKAGDLTFAEKESYFAAAEQSAASAILVSGPFTSERKPLIRVGNARVAMARLLPIFFPPEQPGSGVHATAIIDPTAQIDATAHIGPYCVVGPGV